VPDSFEGLEPAIKRVFDAMVAAGEVVPAAGGAPPAVPEDLAAARRAGRVRAPTHIASSICDDRGEVSNIYIPAAPFARCFLFWTLPFNPLDTHPGPQLTPNPP
jgi:hypothetical protein